MPAARAGVVHGEMLVKEGRRRDPETRARAQGLGLDPPEDGADCIAARDQTMNVEAFVDDRRPEPRAAACRKRDQQHVEVAGDDQRGAFENPPLRKPRPARDRKGAVHIPVVVGLPEIGHNPVRPRAFGAVHGEARNRHAIAAESRDTPLDRRIAPIMGEIRDQGVFGRIKPHGPGLSR